MQKTTIRLPDDLMQWLKQQAKANCTSANKHVECILKAVKEKQEKQRLDDNS